MASSLLQQHQQYMGVGRRHTRNSNNRRRRGDDDDSDDDSAISPVNKHLLSNVDSAQHRVGLSRVLDTLRMLQGIGSQPSEERIVRHSDGHTYEVFAYGYSQPLLEHHFARVGQDMHVGKVGYDFSLVGTNVSTGPGALCVLVDFEPTSAATASMPPPTPMKKRSAAACNDDHEEEEDKDSDSDASADAGGGGGARYRQKLTHTDGDDNDASGNGVLQWIANLFLP